MGPVRHEDRGPWAVLVEPVAVAELGAPAEAEPAAEAKAVARGRDPKDVERRGLKMPESPVKLKSRMETTRRTAF